MDLPYGRFGGVYAFGYNSAEKWTDLDEIWSTLSASLGGWPGRFWARSACARIANHFVNVPVCIRTGGVLHIPVCIYTGVIHIPVCTGVVNVPVYIRTGGVLHVSVEHRHWCRVDGHVLFPSALRRSRDSLRCWWVGGHSAVAKPCHLLRTCSGQHSSHHWSVALVSIFSVCPVCARASSPPPYPLTSPPSTLSFSIFYFLTGSIARSAKCRLFNLLRGRFWGFSPRKATRCTDGGEIWHGGGDLRSPFPCQISPPSVQR